MLGLLQFLYLALQCFPRPGWGSGGEVAHKGQSIPLELRGKGNGFLVVRQIVFCLIMWWSIGRGACGGWGVGEGGGVKVLVLMDDLIP